VACHAGAVKARSDGREAGEEDRDILDVNHSLNGPKKKRRRGCSEL
jgi:hypothetical protein